MRVVAYDPFVGEDRFREAGIEREPTLEGVLGAADFVTLHLPLTDETAGMIGREAIASMRDGARLINAARGALVDEDALVEAIRSGKLAGAALDVFSTEPYSGPLLELDEVVVTPHLAASTDEAQDRAGRDRRGADRRSARGRPGHERGQHPGRRRGRPGDARPVHPARGEARPAGGGARGRVAEAGGRRRARAALRVRHPSAHRRGAERDLPGHGSTRWSTT